MGADMHCLFQKKTGPTWEQRENVYSPYDGPRHYLLHDILGGDADHFLDRTSMVAPLRGLPEDMVFVNALYERNKRSLPTYDGQYLGDRNQTWYTVEELLAWRAGAEDFTTKLMAMVLKEIYKKSGRPIELAAQPGYYDLVFEKNPRQPGNDKRLWWPQYRTEETYLELLDTGHPPFDYVGISWEGSALKSIDYFFREIALLQKEHGEVRMVLGFCC